jgi:hypothetical protein
LNVQNKISNKDPLQELTENELQAVFQHVTGYGTAWKPGRNYTKPGIWLQLQWIFEWNRKIKKEMT